MLLALTFLGLFVASKLPQTGQFFVFFVFCLFVCFDKSVVNTSEGVSMKTHQAGWVEILSPVITSLVW